MKFLVAPNAMKGALSSVQIASIIAKTLRRKYPEADIVALPVADGGNGTLDCLMSALGGTVFHRTVTGPVPTMTVNARYGITDSGIGVIESAEAIGLHLISPTPETVAHGTSRGIGELLAGLEEHSCSEIWIGLGGTATNDGGAGMAAALGWNFFDEQGEPVKDGCIHLLKMTSCHPPVPFQKTIPVKILTDVNNPLLGENGATAAFAPQKGAAPDQLPYLEAALKNFSDIIFRDMKTHYADVAGSGAAGGLAYGLLTFTNAHLVSGIDQILSATRFDEHLSGCDYIITAEGTLDEQTLSGKGISGIARHARKMDIPVHAFVGRTEGSADDLQHRLGLASLTQISPAGLDTEQSMRDASWLLADAVYHHQF